MKMYYYDEKLLLVNRVWQARDLNNVLAGELSHKTKNIYDAHIIISRILPTKFKTLKNRNGSGFFITFLKSHGINIKVSCASISGEYYEYDFETEKDQFLFNLKFGRF